MKIPGLVYASLIFTIFISNGFCQFEDSRCRCVCPSASIMFNDKNLTTRSLYVKNIAQTKCFCSEIISEDDIPTDKKTEYCARCECAFEQRNTTTIKVVVSFVICVIGLLVVYLLFLLCLDPMLKQPRKGNQYERQENDEDNIFAQARAGSVNSSSTSMDVGDARLRRAGETVLNKVEQQQTRWIEKVHEQRRKIFTDHTMLN